MNNSKKYILDLYDFKHLNNQEQYNKLNEILYELYEDKISLNDYYFDKIISLSYDSNNSTIRLPRNLIIKKEYDNLIFKFNKFNSYKYILSYLFVILITIIFCSYFGKLNDYSGNEVNSSCENICELNDKCELPGTGNGTIDLSTLSLKMVYPNNTGLVIDNIIPSDTDGFEVQDYTFTISNNSTTAVTYSLKWIVYNNSFVSDNLKYKINSTNNGYKQDWTTYPISSSLIATNIRINANTTQTYTLNTVLKGEYIAQNYDQDRNFSGKIVATHVQKID